MTLIEAFLRYGMLPADQDAEGAQQTAEAAAVVHAELRRLARQLRFRSPDVKEEAVAIVGGRLWELGPEAGRDARGVLPQTDQQVRALLRVMLRNQCLDIIRMSRTVSLEEVLETEPKWESDSHTNPSVPDFSLERRRDALMAYAATLNAGDRNGVEAMMQIAEGRLTFEELLDADLPSTSGAATATRTKARNRRYQQFKRALVALRQAIDVDPQTAVWDKDGLRGAAEELRLRPPSAPRLKSRRPGSRPGARTPSPPRN